MTLEIKVLRDKVDTSKLEVEELQIQLAKKQLELEYNIEKLQEMVDYYNGK